MISQEIGSILKNQIRDAGYSQRELADILQVSYPTVKRWLSGKGLDIDVVYQILEVLNIDLETLGSMLPAKQRKVFRYSQNQEEFFADNPEYLAYFDHLLKGWTPGKIADKYDLCYSRTRNYLRELEDLGLIEVHKGDKVRILVAGEAVWKKNGVLANKLKANAMEEYLQDSKTLPDLYLHDYLREDVTKIKALIEDLKQTIQRANQRAQHSKETKPYGLLIGFKKFKWHLLEEIT